MTDTRRKLIEILSVPIYPHLDADPAEVVADYLLDNSVTIPVRCKDCSYHGGSVFAGKGNVYCQMNRCYFPEDGFCSKGERTLNNHDDANNA